MDQPITFIEEDARSVRFLHHDPLVIETPIANKVVVMILVDNGSSVNLLFKDTFTAIGLTKRDLSPSNLQVTRFNRTTLIPMGKVGLSVTLCLDTTQSTFKYCTFVVVDCPTPYNTILALEPLEDIEEVRVCDLDPSKVIRLGKGLELEEQSNIIDTIKASTDVFAWCHGDMIEISPHVITHVLNVNPDMPLMQQKRRLLYSVKVDALEKEVDKLLSNIFIRDVYYPEWLANPVLVPKPNRTWQVCIDFFDLNKACPKDCFPLPRIDQMVDATLGHALVDFIVECNKTEASASMPTQDMPTWKVYVDITSNENGSGAGITMISLDGLRLQATLRFTFSASNNEVEYEALIVGLRLAKAIGANRVEVESLEEFKEYKVEQIPRGKNTHADFLAKLASDSEIEKLGVVLVEHLTKPSIRA
uniref:RNase H type-1 domain-containing protein n=1 Tax=Cannabis sativa TaxID=3483 RepID=A0A803PAC4_CANSA